VIPVIGLKLSGCGGPAPSPQRAHRYDSTRSMTRHGPPTARAAMTFPASASDRRRALQIGRMARYQSPGRVFCSLHALCMPICDKPPRIPNPGCDRIADRAPSLVSMMKKGGHARDMPALSSSRPVA